MKIGYKRLLVFILSIIIILLVNTFFVNFLSGYGIILFIFALLCFFSIYFIFEKDKHVYINDILFEVFIYIVMFFILYYLLGLVVGLARNVNYFTWNGIINFIFPILIYIILKEVFRYNMLNKADGSKLCTIIVIILFIIMDLSNDWFKASFDNNYETFRFFTLTVLPVISKNISYSSITKKTGYKPIILFDLIFSLFPYVVPIIPNPNEYIVSIIYLLVPVLFAFRIFHFFELKKLDRITSNYKKKNFKGIILPFLLVILMVYFYSGYFKYYAIAIASGSMSKVINKGDVVIIDQKYSDLNVNDVIAFKHDNIIVVHRIVKIIKVDDSYYYYTKGDANKNIDDLAIDKNLIVGKVVSKISYLGFPTIWFKNN